MIAASTRYISYPPVVETTDFIVPFPIYGAADLTVKVDGVAAAFTLTASFTDGVATNGIISLSTPAIGVAVEIIGTREIKRDDTLATGQPRIVERVETELSALTAIAQEARRDIDAALRLPPGYEGGLFPVPNNDAVIGWQDNALVNKASVPTIPISAVLPVVTTLAGDGSTVTFALDGEGLSTPGMTQVFVDGAFLEPSAYAVSGASITFDTAPDLAASIVVVALGEAPVSGLVSSTAERDDTSTDVVLQAKGMADHLANGPSDHSDLVPVTRTVTGAGLATGGGALSGNQSITVTKATQAEAEAGVLDNVAMTPLKTKQAVEARRFTSAEQTITAGGTLTIAHGLGAVPYRVSADLICQAGEFGYSAGDVLEAPIAHYGTSSTSAAGMTIRKSSTNIEVQFGGNTQVFFISRRDGTLGSGVGITSANWRLVFKAER